MYIILCIYIYIIQIFYKTSSRAPTKHKLFMTRIFDNTGPIGHKSHTSLAFSHLVGSHLVHLQLGNNHGERVGKVQKFATGNPSIKL